MDKLRMGFIGAGRITDLHYLGYKDNPNAKLYAIADANESLLEQRVREWEVEKAYTDYHQLLADPEVDAVEVITPHHLHAEMAIAALGAGKHVSVQKPMAMNLAEADAMIEAAKRSGKLFRVFENFRFYPPYTKAKELIEAGEIGELLSIRIKSIDGNRQYGWEVPRSAWSWRGNPATCGGGPVLFDHGYHIWSIAIYFLGNVERVHAFIGNTEVHPGWFADSPSMITWKYADVEKYGSYETVASRDLLVRSKYYASDEWTEITGSRGVIWVNHCSGEMLDVPPVQMYRDRTLTNFSNIDWDWAASFVNGVHDFANAIRENRESEIPGREAKEVLRFSLAIQLSGREHREVRLDEITE